MFCKKKEDFLLILGGQTVTVDYILSRQAFILFVKILKEFYSLSFINKEA